MFFDTVRYQLFDGKLWCPLFFCLRKFSMPELFWNIERTMYKVSRHCETKDFQRKLVISPSYAKDISILEFIWNTEGVPYEIFRYCETKILTKNCDTPPLLFSMKNSEVFWNKGFPLRCFFRYCEISVFRRKGLMSPVFLSSKFFDARKFLKHRTDHLQSFSALWEKRFPTDSSDLPFLFKRCFDTRIYLKHGRGPLRNISVLWDKNFEKKSWYTPSPFIH